MSHQHSATVLKSAKNAAGGPSLLDPMINDFSDDRRLKKESGRPDLNMDIICSTEPNDELVYKDPLFEFKDDLLESADADEELLIQNLTPKQPKRISFKTSRRPNDEGKRSFLAPHSTTNKGGGPQRVSELGHSQKFNTKVKAKINTGLPGQSHFGPGGSSTNRPRTKSGYVKAGSM